MNGKNRQELMWKLFRSFFRSRSAFLVLFDRYEARVLAFSERFKMHRKRLRLGADDLLTVLDLKSLEELRDREILTLKQTAHDLFRAADATDPLDHHVSSIYHEISMLKEEHYTLKQEFVRSDEKEYDHLFREVSEFYPKRLRHVKNLYRKALRRLEELLPLFAKERIAVRSIYLFGAELLGDAYPGGLKGLYRKMYPELGEVKGFAEAGRSFEESGFDEEAVKAYEETIAAAKKRRKRELFAPILEDVEARLLALRGKPSAA